MTVPIFQKVSLFSCLILIMCATGCQKPCGLLGHSYDEFAVKTSQRSPDVAGLLPDIRAKIISEGGGWMLTQPTDATISIMYIRAEFSEGYSHGAIRKSTTSKAAITGVRYACISIDGNQLKYWTNRVPPKASDRFPCESDFRSINGRILFTADLSKWPNSEVNSIRRAILQATGDETPEWDERAESEDGSFITIVGKASKGKVQYGISINDLGAIESSWQIEDAGKGPSELAKVTDKLRTAEVMIWQNLAAD